MDIDELFERVRDPVFFREDDGYDSERAGFQTAARHRSVMIVGVTEAEDVQAAVEFATAQAERAGRPDGTGTPRRAHEGSAR